MQGHERQREYAEHARRTHAAQQQQQARAYQQAMHERGPQQARQVSSMEARYDPTAAMAMRAASQFQMQNGSIPMGATQSGRRVHFDPSLEGTRHAVPRPVPPRIPMTDRVTGSGPLIQPMDDPLENLVGETQPATNLSPYDSMLEVILRSMQVLLLCILAGSVFALPEQARILWLVVAVQIGLAGVGSFLYDVAMRTPEGAPSWLHTMFSGLLVSHVIVCAVVVAATAWRIYKTVWSAEEKDEDDGFDDAPPRRSNSMSSRVQVVASSLAPPMEGNNKMMSEKKMRKRKRRMMMAGP